MAARNLPPCSGLYCTPADQQQTSARPCSTNVTEPLPGFRRESVLQGMDMLRCRACQCQ